MYIYHLHTDILDENAVVLVFLMLFQCHQESAQFNIVSVFLNIIFKHNFKKLLNSLESFLFSFRGTKTIAKL